VVSFIEQPSEQGRVALEAGPSIFPAALPPQFARYGLPKSTKAQRINLLALAASLHVLAIITLWDPATRIDLVALREQARLTLVQLSNPISAPLPKEPESRAEPAEVVTQTEGVPAAEIEWARVPNWRPKANGTAATSGGTGNGYDATRLLAGLGATGPAGQADGVADPYAGASPIWSGNGSRSDLWLAGAPNPAALEQIRQRITKTFRGISGYARVAVAVDAEGVVTGIVRCETDLPESVRKLLEESLLGRVVSGRKPVAGTVDLPEMRFG
jgi:hypothetical protein